MRDLRYRKIVAGGPTTLGPSINRSCHLKLFPFLHSHHQVFSMAPKIYKSTYPDVHIPDQSIFTHIFPENDRFDRSLPAFIDVQTDCTVTRGEMRENSLCFAAGLVGPNQVLAAHGGPSFVRGDVISIYRLAYLFYDLLGWENAFDSVFNGAPALRLEKLLN